MTKVMLVTGSSRGIGAQTVYLAGKKGYNVCVNYLSDEKSAHKVVHKITESGGKAIAVRADVSIENNVHFLFEEVQKKLGNISVLVNNAGIIGKQMRVDEMDEERLNKIFTRNITGYFLCAKYAIHSMSTKYGGKGGVIINVSSAASRLGSPFEYVDYAASKGAIDTLTIGLSKEVAGEGIRVNAVRPAFIHTDIHASGGDPDRIDRLKKDIPMQRGGTPQEVANAILWLASAEASYATGTFIDLAGGK